VRSYGRLFGDEERIVGRKVGEMAALTGLTVRTLHYYEEIGLLTATERSDGGHRVYSPADVERLYRIALLRRFGLPLQEIGRALDDPAWSLRGALESHRAELEQRLDATSRLHSRVLGLLSCDVSDHEPLDDDLLALLEDMTMLDARVQRRITFLVYTDLETAYNYLTDVFGLGRGKLDRTEDGRAVHGELHAGDGVIWLHSEDPDFRLASPRTLGAATSGVAVMVDDVDEHHRQVRDKGASIAQEPVDQPYGYRVYSAWDPEGGLWSFMRALD
jgi:MerR family transcriptional regulator, thiopeptide resistance regulator